MRLRALAATAVVGAVVAVGPVGPAGLGPRPVAAVGPSPQWHDGACAPDDTVGVTVVVDFQELGGGVNVRCTERPPRDGADALDAAGISWQGVVRWGRGFVCRIAGQPADDPCIDTPPASAYWSYWLAPRGGSWCYSNLGVLARTPPPGTVEGWSFSLDRDGGQSPPPRTAPPPLAPGLRPTPLGADDCDPSGPSVPTTTTPATTAPAPDRPGGGGTATPIPGDDPPSGGGGGEVGGGGGADGGAPGVAPGSSTSTEPADGSSTTTSTPASTTASSSSTAEDDGRGREGPDERALGGANPTDLSHDGTAAGGGFPASTAAGVAAVLALAAGGAVVARRRRVGAPPDAGDGPG